MKAAFTIALLVSVAQAGVFFQDDFENGMTSNGEFMWRESIRTKASATQARDGKSSLEFTFNACADGEDAFSEQRFRFIKPRSEVWVSYDLYIPANYYHRDQSGSTNNKGFLYLWAGDYSGSGSNGPGMGPNFWAGSNGTSNASFFVWGDAAHGGAGKHFWSSDPAWVQKTVIGTQDRGKWMHVVVHYKYATSANNNGVAEIWKTPAGGSRTKLLSIQNGNWYESGQAGFDQGYLLGWANSGFSQETKLYIDNIAFSTTSLLDQAGIGTVPVISVVERASENRFGQNGYDVLGRTLGANRNTPLRSHVAYRVNGSKAIGLVATGN